MKGTWNERRMKIIERIRETIRQATIDKHEPVIKEKLIALICQQHGTARRTAMEYVNQLFYEDYIFEDAEGLWLNDKIVNAVLESRRKILKKEEEEINEIIQERSEERIPTETPA